MKTHTENTKMTKQEHRVSVDSGKYTFLVAADDYRVSILRHGKEWIGPMAEGCNALCSIMAELDAARVVLQAAREVVASSTEGLAPIGTLQRALELHDRLVDDRETPSAWSGAAGEPAAPAEPAPVGYLSDARIAEIGKRVASAVERVDLMTSVHARDLQLMVGELQRRRGHD